MASQTLAEAAKLINNELIQGVAEDIITTSPVWLRMPWIGYEGQALLVNRENALGDAQHLAVGLPGCHDEGDPRGGARQGNPGASAGAIPDA